MHCMGMPFNGNTINERSLGGSETAAYYMAKELAKLGHKVTMFTATDHEEETDGVKYVPHGAPNEREPLGADFHNYAMHTPHDVMIIQRHPKAFMYNWASKINLWWVHDLALKRNKNEVHSMLWNITGILSVSEWHKEQMVKVYGLNPDIVMPITNGVDLSLYEREIEPYEIEDGKVNVPHKYELPELVGKTFKMLYTSRPERGLEYLVKPDGIMEQLHELKPEAHLYVCAYDNVTPQMAQMYAALMYRCKELPNVTVLGALTKQELADVQRQCDLHVYPSAFEETSCITAMECMAAGLPMLATEIGALPETTKDAGVMLIPGGDDLVEKFVSAIIGLAGEDLSIASRTQKGKAKKYDWLNVAYGLASIVDHIFNAQGSRLAAKAKELMRNSDIYALHHLISNATKEQIESPIVKKVVDEFMECYAFMKEDVWDGHYAKYYQYEKDRGVNYGPEKLDGNPRFEVVSGHIANLPAGSTVLDYGCAHGHYTINLAKRFPEIQFIGMDITISNIAKARSWAKEEGLTNVSFGVGEYSRDEVLRYCGSNANIENTTLNEIEPSSLGAIIAAEVLEHLRSPAECVDYMTKLLKPEGQMIITVPYGPWEAQGYKDHWPWRAHVHHLEREDIYDLWGHFDNFAIKIAPAGQDARGDAIGSYVVTFDTTSDVLEHLNRSGTIDYDRKLFQMNPRGTVSLCMIVHNAENNIRRCLEAAVPQVDEIIINIDPNRSDKSEQVIIDYMAEHWPEKQLSIKTEKSPMEIGFDEARNATLDRASGDWILWLDTDEFMHNGQQMFRFLRTNQYDGYAVAQHHFSMQPLGVMKTDLPTRLFRNNNDIKFFGVVHEHPEKAINEGIGHASILAQVSLAHEGYTDDMTRRGRFQRNIELLVRDREKYPDRKLGKFLWLRDLSQMCGFDMEQGSGITDQIIARANRGIEIFEELLEDPSDIRMAADGVEFYSNLARILGGGFEFAVKLDTNVMGQTHIDEVKPVIGYFHSKEHVHKLVDNIINERTKDYEETKYI